MTRCSSARASRGCSTDCGFEVVAQAGTADELVRKVRMHQPDVAVVDIRMPPTHTDEGLVAAKSIRADQWPSVGVLVLSQYVEAALRARAAAGLRRGRGLPAQGPRGRRRRVRRAVRRVAEGGSALDPSVVSQLVGRRRRDDPLAELTPREREVLGLMAEGRSNARSPTKLVVTPRAVEKHVTNIFTKLDLRDAAKDHRRVLAVLRYLQSL